MTQLKNYLFPAVLLLSIILGGVAGCYLGPQASILKPLGDIFLNLIFTVIVPLIFFSVASAVARIGAANKFFKLLATMLMVFLFTSIVAGIFMLVVVLIYPPAQGVFLTVTMPEKINQISLASQIVNIFTVPEFSKLLTHENMLAIIFFSILVGFATASAGQKGKIFLDFLESGTEIFMRIITYIMYYAPIGFFAYFAVVVGELGPKILENYLRASIIYYIAGIAYFVFGFTFYAYLAGGFKSIKLFWQNSLVPTLTALATCSSAASIPANLQATKNMNVPAPIYETVIPLGTVIHKDGTVLGAILKIAFLFGVYHLCFAGAAAWVTALVVALLVGTVMGAIPSGGMLGEMLILSLYGFPPQALIIIAAISIIIDPLATMLNVMSNAVCSMLIAKWSARLS